MSTAPDGCFPRHDGSGADPRRTLSHALSLSRGAPTRKEPAARSAKEKRRASAHASTGSEQ